MLGIVSSDSSFIKFVLITLLNNLEWVTKKKLDFDDWKLIFSLIEKGWHL